MIKPSEHSKDNFIKRIDRTLTPEGANVVLIELHARSIYISPRRWGGTARWPKDTAYRYVIHRSGNYQRGVILIIRDHTIITIKPARKYFGKYYADHRPALGAA